MIDQAGLIETLEFRKRQLRMRLVLAALISLGYGHLVGWGITAAWFAIYVALQFIEHRVRMRVNDATGLLPEWQVRGALALMFCNGVVFGGYALISPLTYGPWGMANGGFMLAGAILNVAVLNRSKATLLVSMAPYALYFPLMALASLHMGASWPVTLSLLIAGPMVIGPAVMMWFDADRLRVTEGEAQRRRLEAEQANSAKDAFLAMMSHEIRTPLNGVLGMAHVMERDDLTDAQRERVRIIREAGQNLFVILDDILDISKIGAGKLTLESIEFDLEEVVRGACAAFVPGAEQKGLFFDLSFDPTVGGRYLGDPTRLRQVVCNLVSNAVKFTTQGGVRLLVFSAEEQVCLVVTDTGDGMDPQQLAVLFQPFNQADLSTTRRFGGTGLGLSISSQLVEAMGGRIEVRSRPGAGSAFSVFLPLERIVVAQPQRIAPPEPAPLQPADAVVDVIQAAEAGTPEMGDVRILAAEDNVTNQLVLKTLLAQAGLRLTIVPDGAAAVNAWREGGWDLILMDVRMPIMDGPSATREIRRLERETGRARTPIIALTANVMPHQVAEYTQAGMDGLIPKPIDIARLFATIEQALDEADAARAAA